jgi:hypothetical protein
MTASAAQSFPSTAPDVSSEMSWSTRGSYVARRTKYRRTLHRPPCGRMVTQDRTSDLLFIPLLWSDSSVSTASGTGPQLSLISGPCSMRTHAPRRSVLASSCDFSV